MKLIAVDTVRISSAGGRLEAGQKFEVSDHEAEVLIARGIAVLPADYAGKAAPAKAKAKAKSSSGPAPEASSGEQA